MSPFTYSSKAQVAIVHYSFPRIAFSSIGLFGLEIVFEFLIVLSTKLDLPLSFLLPILNSFIPLLFPLLTILFFLKHFFMHLLFHYLLMFAYLCNLLFFLLCQIIVFLWCLESSHCRLELLLWIRGVTWKLCLLLHLHLHLGYAIVVGHLIWWSRLLQNKFLVSFVELSKRVHPRH